MRGGTGAGERNARPLRPRVDVQARLRPEWESMRAGAGAAERPPRALRQRMGLQPRLQSKWRSLPAAGPTGNANLAKQSGNATRCACPDCSYTNGVEEAWLRHYGHRWNRRTTNDFSY